MSQASLRAAARCTRRHAPPLIVATLAALLAACGSRPPTVPAPAPPVITPAPDDAPPAVRATGRGRWVQADWKDLPGWDSDGLVAAWPALLRSCERPTPAWAATCPRVRALGAGADESQVRAFLREQLQPWRVETTEGQTEGLLTGYFEPLIEASRQAGGRYTVPLYAPPADLGQRKPWYTRAEIGSLPAAQAALKGREIAYVADPLEALMLQIQGSGRLSLVERNGQRTTVRLAYAGSNDQPYRSVGRWLIEQKALTADQASWPGIKAWAKANAPRQTELLNVNPRYVFFKEQPLPDPSVGPQGAQGVALTPGRSIAVDKESIPYGTPVWLASTEPPLRPGLAPRPLQRLVVAQDTGSAITGAVRADYFWGWGDGAEEHAGRTRQALRMWVFWPR